MVVTKEEEERAPHPVMGVSTGELVRRLRETLPPYQQKRLTHVAMPGPGRKAHQLNWALRPEVLREVLGEDLRPAPRLRGGERRRLDARIPTPTAGSPSGSSRGRGRLAYQGIPLSLANYDRLDIRGRICAIQQSSIFIRVSIARLHQRGQARAALRRASRRGAPARRGGARPPSSSSSGARRSAWATTSSCAWTPCRRSGGFPDLGRHRGLHARLRARARAAS